VPVHPAILTLFAPYPTCNLRFPLLSQGLGRLGTWGTRFQQWGTTPTPTTAAARSATPEGRGVEFELPEGVVAGDLLVYNHLLAEVRVQRVR